MSCRTAPRPCRLLAKAYLTLWRPTLCALLLTSGLIARPARAEETRFAVVNLTPSEESERVVGQVEKDAARLRSGSKPIEDPVFRRLLASGEGPVAAATRLLKEAQGRREAGDCAGALPRAEQAEGLMLQSMSFDEERDPLKALYALEVICEHELGHADKVRTAALRLQALVSGPPEGFPPDLWQEQVATVKPPERTVELQIDSDPPNAQIQIDLHGANVTPRTVKVPKGVVYLEVQKDGFKKSFRRVEVGSQPTRTVFRLVERSRDRLEQTQNTLNVLLRGGAELKDRPQTLSKLAQLVRADALLLLRADKGQARIWVFDAERGAMVGDPVSSPYDPATGQVKALLAPGGGTAPGKGASGPAAPGGGGAQTPSPAAVAPGVPIPGAGGAPTGPAASSPSEAGPAGPGAPSPARGGPTTVTGATGGDATTPGAGTATGSAIAPGAGTAVVSGAATTAAGSPASSSARNTAGPGASGSATAPGGNAAPSGAAPQAGLSSTAAPPGVPAASEPPQSAPLPFATAPDAQAQKNVTRPRRPPQSPSPWWGWVIAGAIAVAFGVFVYSQRTESADTLGVRARWTPPSSSNH